MTNHAGDGRTCAYCGMQRRLTKEHIWPKSIIRRVGKRASYNPKAGKFFWTDMVITDVCEQCNNGPLSTLDAYGAELYDHYFGSYYLGSKPVEFACDFQRFAKWLLKLSFNAARANGSDYPRLSKYAPYLIDPVARLPDDFTIAADLVLPGAIDPKSEPLLPGSNRICRIDFTKPIDDWCTVRLVAINSYYFWILIQDVPDSQVNLSHAKAVLARIPGTAIARSGVPVSLKSSGADVFNMHKDWKNAVRNVDPPAAK